MPDSSSSSSFAGWEPITVEIVVSSVSQLRDRAISMWAAAGDTVVIDGATVAQGTAGRGIFRIFGFAAFLTQIGGTPEQYRPYPNMGYYTYPDNRTRNLGGAWMDGNHFRGVPITQTNSPSLSGPVNGGVCTLVDPVTITVQLSQFPAQVNCGDVTFYCGDMVRTVHVSQFTGSASITFTGNDLHGAPQGSYTLTAVYTGCTTSTGVQYNGATFTCNIGVN